MADNKLKRTHGEDDDSNAHKKNRLDHGSPAPSTTTQAPPPVDIQKMIADAQARAKALAAQAGLKSTSAASGPAPAAPRKSKLEEMKARIAAATNANRSEATHKTPVFDESLSKARGGLEVGLHPALLPDAPAISQETQLEKDPKKNPYLAHLLDQSDIEPVKLNSRSARPLKFVEHGKYIEQGANLRRLGQLEKMKQRIEAEAREAELQRSMEPDLLISEPPDFEWWDELLISGDDYSGIDDPRTLKIDGADSIITPYVQHPVLVDSPKLKLAPVVKPLYLTKKEQAKLRRQQRLKLLKEEQVKMTLGLVPKPGPKIKLNNLMSVLGNKAVADPTAMEAEVLQGIKDRRDKHEATNAERSLTKEQRQTKLAAQQEKDAKLGLFMNVYRIDTLASGKHRFLISKNAQQNVLTGICLLNPKCNLVIVEGGAHSMRNFQKLMLNRVKWKINEGVKAGFANDQKEGREDPPWLNPLDESGSPKDFSHNTCTLLFEGPIKARQYRLWLSSKICETDVEAKNSLSRFKLDNFWAMATNQPAEEFDVQT
ncbi:U4/U6 small nuclear ribonucleoprotein [Penicillium taxi]|uniref:U4/U6 small nuclear ribonucleoprotein n=1 Tax=Penicillium taxi TaxID=168475 RepID=UPI00254531BD|nr:U4/U6 small nuclear ribonucleoprotein [Penicillium taxi]KAJ5901841.1 U4/U6 small nuclear ribonucleoprotein [Penicillium taxi]